MATAASNVFGSCIFCKRCGTLFDLPGDEDYLTCDACGAQEDAQSRPPSRSNLWHLTDVDAVQSTKSW